ncbi:MAG: hypothetical protein QW035_03270 [Candidatus Anstonellales archaeon]
MGLSSQEIIEIAIAFVALTAGIAIAIEGIGIIFEPLKMGVLMLALGFTVGVGFVLHEMAHKATANFFGVPAEFRMWKEGIILMLITSLVGFVFAAPGAVYIFANKLKREENAIISLAGPTTNIVLGSFFVILAILFPLTLYGVKIFLWGAKINYFLAFFNLLPIFPLDGSKVIMWNSLVWILFIGIAFLLGFVFI